MVSSRARKRFGEWIARFTYAVFIPVYATVALIMAVRLLLEFEDFRPARLFFSYYMVVIVALLVWRFGKWARVQLGNYWALSTPPHPDEGDYDSSSEIFSYIRSEFRFPRRDYTTESIKPAILLGLVEFIFANAIFIVGGLFTTVIPSYGTESASIDSSGVSVISAFISVILGPLFGGILLFLNVFTPTLDSAINLILFIGLPTIALAPALQNFQYVLEVQNARFVEYIMSIGGVRGAAMAALGLIYLIFVLVTSYIIDPGILQSVYHTVYGVV